MTPTNPPTNQPAPAREAMEKITQAEARDMAVSFLNLPLNGKLKVATDVGLREADDTDYPDIDLFRLYFQRAVDLEKVHALRSALISAPPAPSRCMSCGEIITEPAINFNAPSDLWQCADCHFIEWGTHPGPQILSMPAPAAPATSGTPRTDAHLELTRMAPGKGLWATADFARTLESDLAAANAEVSRMRNRADNLLVPMRDKAIADRDRLQARVEALEQKCESIGGIRDNQSRCIGDWMNYRDRVEAELAALREDSEMLDYLNALRAGGTINKPEINFILCTGDPMEVGGRTSHLDLRGAIRAARASATRGTT